MNAERLHEATARNLALQSHKKWFLRQEVESRKQLIARLTPDPEYQSYAALLSPLQQGVLPAEILGEIFVQVLALTEERLDAQLVDICLVCSSWRRVALSTPQLWCSIQGLQFETSKIVLLDRAQVWLMRGRSLSKSLQLYAWDLDLQAGQSLVRLLTQVPALETLSIEGLPMRCIQVLLKSFGFSKADHCQSLNSFKLLSLELDINDRDVNGDLGPPKPDILHQLPPTLKNLKLALPCFLDIPHDHFPRPLCSQNITKLELIMSLWPTHWILHCADSCTNLQDLTIDLYDLDADWDTMVPGHPAKQQYHLTHLQTLRFRRFRDRHSTTTILRFLRTPSLIELDIAFDCQRDNPGNAEDVERDPLFTAFADDMKDFMEQPGCAENLRRLRITDVYLPWVTLKPLLKTLHSITHLTLDDVWARWSENPWPIWPKALVPRLEYLEVLNMDDSFDPDTILRYVHARQKSSEKWSRIKKVSMSMYREHSSRYPNEGVIARRLKRWGVEVEVDVEHSNGYWRWEWRLAVHAGALAPFPGYIDTEFDD